MPDFEIEGNPGNIRAKAVLMDIDARVFTRKDVVRLGLAPLTSMYWFSETEKPTAIDWRPEIHDSDGLALWTGTGERIWRPLNNPRQVRASSFADTSPRGFGLMQRDRQRDFVQHLLEPEFLRLMHDDEQHFVVQGRERSLRSEQIVQR